MHGGAPQFEQEVCPAKSTHQSIDEDGLNRLLRLRCVGHVEYCLVSFSGENAITARAARGVLARLTVLTGLGGKYRNFFGA